MTMFMTLYRLIDVTGRVYEKSDKPFTDEEINNYEKYHNVILFRSNIKLD
ncbi:MAG: hypothetical protein ACOC2W_02535 [bacterium]